MKQPEDYLEYREIRPDFSVAFDELPGGRAVIMAFAAGLSAGWEYENITVAAVAWLAWNPEQNNAPQGFTRCVDASGLPFTRFKEEL